MVASFGKKCTVLLLLLTTCVAVKADGLKLQSSLTYVQPGCGLVLWPDNAEDLNGTYNQSVALEFQYCLPCKVVTGKKDGRIQYNWTWLENILKAVAGRGHQAVLRFRYEYPSGTDVDGKTKGMTAVPDYIKNLSDYTETYKKVSGDGPTYYADWSNTELQWFTKQFYTDFAARYGQDTRIAYLEVGFGHWSEYHIYGGPTLSFGNNFPTKQYQSEFFRHLDTIMPIPWLVSVDAGDDTYSPLQTDKTMQACRFGLFDDSFMHEEHDLLQGEGWNEQCWQWCDPQGNRWRTGVNGGEISYYTDDDQKNFLNPNGMYGVTWEKAAAKYHITFMNSNDAPEGKYGTAARFLSAGLATGYHFKVVAASVSAESTQLRVTNTGVAPIYRDAYFAIGTVRSTRSLRGLCPGDTITCTIPVVLTDSKSLHVASDYVLPARPIQYEASCVVQVGTDLYGERADEKTSKVLRDGKVYILRNGITYDIYGRR